MKNINLILLLLLFLIVGCSKKEALNSNKNVSNDSLALYLKLANDYDLPYETKLLNNEKALQIIIDQPNDSINRVNFFKIANRYYNMWNWQEYKKTVNVALAKAIEGNDSLSISKAYTYLGDYYSGKSLADSAFVFYTKAEKIFFSTNNIHSLSKTKLNKALLQYNEGDFYGSEKMIFNVLNIVRGKDFKDINYESYNLLGILYNELGDYDKSLEFHNKAIINIDDNTIPPEFQSKATSLNNIGVVYLKMQEYHKAERYFTEALNQKLLKNQKPQLNAMLIDNLAYTQLELGNNENLPKLFYKSLKIRDSLQLTAGIIASKLHLSEYYIANNDKAKGLQYLKEALATAKTSGNARNVLVALKQLSVLEPQKASVYSKSYIRINDSLQKAERKMGDKFTRIEYETDQVINENQALSMQNRTLFYVFSILCLIGLFFYSYKSQQSKHRELIFRQQQQVANEDIYNLMIQQQNQIEGIRINEKKRVAQELHDGVLSRMFGLRMSLDSINQINGDDASKKRTVYLDELKNIEQDIREISHDLSKEKSELINNFVTILDKLLEDQKRNFETCLTVAIDRAIKWENIENAKKINIYRIIQEALQNSNKYAKAQKIDIVLKKQKNTLVLTIIDDGIGFNIRQSKKGIGLQNIQYRIKECNGKFEINSDTNGTVITIIFPIKPNKHNLKNYDV